MVGSALVCVTAAHTMTQELRMFCQRLTSVLMPLLLIAACSPNEPLTEPVAAERKSPPASASADNQLRPDGHNSRNSVDWAGTYSGVLPCASCPGIETEITLHSDGTYERSRRYLDETALPEMDEGAFTWSAGGGKVELNTEGDEVVKYQVGENQLFRLDRDGRRVEGDLAAHYGLQKHRRDSAIEGKRWKLVELRGNPVDVEPDAVLTLGSEGSTATGNSSCNSFSGSYAIKSGQRISFSRHMAATKMACPDMSVEREFFEVLRRVDSYSLSDDGQLSLNRARMAPMARFEVIAKD